MSNEKFEKHKEARVRHVLREYTTRDQLARRVVELEGNLHAAVGNLFDDEWDIVKFLANQELAEIEDAERWTPGD